MRKHLTSGSDYTSENSLRKRSMSRGGLGGGVGPTNNDLSSPDLGVDLVCSDPFSSLERSTDLGRFQALMEENKRLKHDKERLSEKLTQSKGALRETLDRLHKKDAHLSMSPMPSRRIFSSAVAAAVSNKPPPTATTTASLKEEFLAFSKSHPISKKAKAARQTSHEKQ